MVYPSHTPPHASIFSAWCSEDVIIDEIGTWGKQGKVEQRLGKKIGGKMNDEGRKLVLEQRQCVLLKKRFRQWFCHDVGDVRLGGDPVHLDFSRDDPLFEEVELDINVLVSLVDGFVVSPFDR